MIISVSLSLVRPRRYDARRTRSPNAMNDSPRQRMIQSAALLMREVGVENTSFSQVVAHSGAPRGSIYHYFPGGKAQLVEEAVRCAGEFISQAFRHPLDTGDPLELLHTSEAFWRGVLEGSDFAAGCPV